jgi:dihydropteroate synthase
VGVSRKSFIGKILDAPDTAGRLAGSLAATAIAVVNGASLIRTHDVAETRDAVRVAERLRGARAVSRRGGR